MSRTHLIALALSASLPAAAFAQPVLDTNSDGYVSFDEMLEVYPDVTAEQFMAMDTDGDALLTEDEMLAAREAGLLPAVEG